MKFRKKPVVIIAIQWVGNNPAELEAYAGEYFRVFPRNEPTADGATAEVYDKLHNTWIRVWNHQWVVCGVEGEFYPIDEDVLVKTYDLVTDEETN